MFHIPQIRFFILVYFFKIGIFPVNTLLNNKDLEGYSFIESLLSQILLIYKLLLRI